MNVRDISARISIYNGTSNKKGGSTYAYFTDNRFEKILWYRAKYYKSSGWRFSFGRSWRVYRNCRHIRQRKVHTAEHDRRSGCSFFRQGHCGWQGFSYAERFPVLNVYENIVLPVELDGDQVDNKYMQEVVQMLALEDKLNNMPNTLSGGQQQRVAIARALVSKPAIVLADEPTGNLDSRTSTDVLGLLKVSSQKFHQTLIMITHNNEIAQLADRIVRIEDGKIMT